jgi:TetR/AcrR family transcriptional repressor of nem operon
MVRPKEFDAEVALDRALELFWSRGYEATSMRDLQEHMGIGRQSLYDTYGDKHRLFVAALDRYVERGRVTVRGVLDRDDASLEAIGDYFDELVQFLTPKGERSACMLTNCIMEFGQSDSEISQRCRSNERGLAAAFEQALERAVMFGELDELEDPRATATYLVVQVYGLAVLAKNGATSSQLKGAVAQALAAIGG